MEAETAAAETAEVDSAAAGSVGVAKEAARGVVDWGVEARVVDSAAAGLAAAEMEEEVTEVVGSEAARVVGSEEAATVVVTVAAATVAATAAPTVDQKWCTGQSWSTRQSLCQSPGEAQG